MDGETTEYSYTQYFMTSSTNVFDFSMQHVFFQWLTLLIRIQKEPHIDVV
jgi:hypothetical protein